MKVIPILGLCAALSLALSGPSRADSETAASASATAATTTVPTAGSLFQTRCSNLSTTVTAALSGAQTKLAITSAQQSAWAAYTAAVSNAVQTIKTACAAMPATLPTEYPALYALRLTWLAAELKADQSLQSSVTALYAVLTTTQRPQFARLNDRIIAMSPFF